MFTIEQQSRIYPQPFPCPTCKRDHIFKTFHLNLNGDGNVTVSEEIYQAIKDEGFGEQLVATRAVVPFPTTLSMGGIGLGDAAEPSFVVVSRENGLVRDGQALILNAVQPPSGRFRRETDGTWTDLDK